MTALSKTTNTSVKTLRDMNNIVIRYIREDDGNICSINRDDGNITFSASKGKPVGMVLAVKINGEILFGWAILNPLDRFDRQKMLNIAFNRAITGSHNEKVPNRKIFRNGMRISLKEAFNYHKEIVLRVAARKGELNLA